MNDDDRLAARSAVGDQQAYEALVTRYARPLYNAAYRFLGTPDDAEDAAQETLVRLYTEWPRAPLELPLRPWLFRVLHNLCVDLLRRKRAVPFSALESGDGDTSPLDLVADAGPLPEEIFARRDLQGLLTAAIATLPPRFREVVALRYSGELSYTEIATVLGVPESTAKVHFHRAKVLLRRFLLERGMGEDDRKS